MIFMLECGKNRTGEGERFIYLFIFLRKGRRYRYKEPGPTLQKKIATVPLIGLRSPNHHPIVEINKAKTLTLEGES